MFDIDGVLSDNNGRHIESGVALLSSLNREKVFFVTARPDVRKSETESLLDDICRKAGIAFIHNQLYMREDKDKRRDSAVKVDIVEQIMKDIEDDIFDIGDTTYIFIDNTYENIRAVRRKFPEVSGLFFMPSVNKKKGGFTYFG